MTDRAAETVAQGRRHITDILSGRDARLLAVVGPCSIHNEDEALEYAARLSTLSKNYPTGFLSLCGFILKNPGPPWGGGV